ncbi:hypothetical protein KKH27_00490 [bacterium]|nr:hypothetical protein [bacterium]
MPNEVSSRGPNATTIHYFDFNDFLSLCDIVKTLPDLYIYLNERGKLAAWGRPLLTRECDLYAYYLTHAGRLDSTIVASDLIGEWDRLTSQNYREYVEMIEAYKETKVFTLLIEEVRRCVTDFSDYKPGLAGELALSQQQINFLVARKLNALRLIERREFCKRMRDKMTLADASSIGFNFFAAFNDSRDSAILFLASREPRDKRRKCLETLMVYLSVTQHLSEVVGVATENLSVDGGRSCDFAIYNPATAENHDPDDVKLCQRLFKDIEVVRLNVFPGQSRRIINP